MSDIDRLSSTLCPHVMDEAAVNCRATASTPRTRAGLPDIFLFTLLTYLTLHTANSFGPQPANQPGQLQQIFCPEQRPSLGDRDKRIHRDDAGPAGRKRNQLLFAVVEVDPILTPGTLVCDQFERLAPPRVERVNDVKDSCRNVRLRCSCQGGPKDVSNAASVRPRTGW